MLTILAYVKTYPTSIGFAVGLEFLILGWISGVAETPWNLYSVWGSDAQLGNKNHLTK